MDVEVVKVNEVFEIVFEIFVELIFVIEVKFEIMDFYVDVVILSICE